jgi:hypothetical protein
MIALYILIGIILLIIILALVIPKRFHLEREIIINKPIAEVFPYLRSLKNQDNWSVWGKRDPNMKREFRGTDENVGFVNAWEGNKDVGKGEQEIMGIEEFERIDFQLRFEKPFKMTNDAYLITEPIALDKTKVRWGFTGISSRPMNVFSSLMKGTLAKDFDAGLLNLKRILEK